MNVDVSKLRDPMSYDQVVDLIARLLANEDLNVIRQPAQTASFDVGTRTLVLPMWNNVSVHVDQMLVSHEIGHALYTTLDMMDAVPTMGFRNAKAYLNILEDVRVEKLVKRRYPGTRKTFAVGYAELVAEDFFEIKGKDLKKAHLLDRINLYYKAGAEVGVEFSDAEKVFVDRARDTETPEDVIQLAKDIHAFVMEQKEQDDDAPDVADLNQLLEELADDAPKEEGDADSTGEGNTDLQDEDTSPSTDEAFERTLRGTIERGKFYEYWKVMPFKYDPILPYKEVIRRVVTLEGAPDSSDLYRAKQFREDTANNIDFLIKEFELRKAADAHRRTQISKSGSLDMKKVWSYKINNDLFKRVSTVPNGKNHGMVMLVDWSLSMFKSITSVIDQTINLAWFCRRANIPFQVFAFTDNYATADRIAACGSGGPLRAGARFPPQHLQIEQHNLAMIELLSSEMTSSEFNQMTTILRSPRMRRTFDLGGTPLNEALAFMYHYLQKFQQKHKVQKVSFITLTDGEGHSLRNLSSTRYSYRDTRHFIKDEISKKVHEITPGVISPARQTDSLLQMIKDRYDCALLGFYLTPNLAPAAIRSAIENNQGQSAGKKGSVISLSTLDKVIADCKSKGFHNMQGTARDALFIVPVAATVISRDELEVSHEQSAASVARKFGKFMKKRKMSRVLLSQFIDHIA